MTPRSASIPNTPVARRRRIVQILSTTPVRSQSQLEKLLHRDGLDVTQATLSRDLEELGAVKVRDASGALVYAVPEDGTERPARASTEVVPEGRLARLCEELLVSAEASANLVVVRTPPGAAQFFASALDLSGTESIIGTIAGDDTILVITSDLEGGPQLATHLKALAEGPR